MCIIFILCVTCLVNKILQYNTICYIVISCRVKQMGPKQSDRIKQRITLNIITLSGFHCICIKTKHRSVFQSFYECRRHSGFRTAQQRWWFKKNICSTISTLSSQHWEETWDFLLGSLAWAWQRLWQLKSIQCCHLEDTKVTKTIEVERKDNQF